MLLFTLPRQVPVSSGETFAGARGYFTLSGTSTAADVYQDAALTTPHTSPVVASAAGVFPAIYLDETVAYKFTLKSADDSLIYAVDPINEVSTTESLTAAEIAAGLTLADVNLAYEPGNVLRHGAVGDGVTDDRDAINQCCAAAAAGDAVMYFPPGYVFGIRGWINVTNGTRLVHGSGEVKCLSNSNSSPSGVLLKGKAQGEAANVSNCRVEGLYVNRNGQWSCGIYASNVDNVQIINNVVVNGTSGFASDYAGIYVPSFETSVAGTHDVLIQGNYVESDETTSVVAGADGIAVTGTYTVAPYINITEKWKGAFELPTTVNPAYNISVVGNVVLGGYYGISFVETRYSNISSNLVINNIRNISQQSNCLGNLVEGNYCREANSSGLNGGFGMVDCTIRDNKIYSTRAQGEGLLNTYIGCSRNVFENNHTFTTTLNPSYHAYCGIHCADNVFKNNVFSGTCGQAYIAVESAWDNSVTNPAHKNYNVVDASREDYANAATTGTVIEGNIINGSAAVPAIFLGQINSDSTVCGLTGTKVIGNTVIGNTYNYQLDALEQNSGSLSGLVVADNSFDAAATSAKFRLTRGRAHCDVMANNTVLDRGSATVTFGTSDATPSVALGFVFKTADTTTYTDFDDGVDGQEFWLLANHAATVSDNANINTSTGANKTLTVGVLYKFLSVGGVWYEQATT